MGRPPKVREKWMPRIKGYMATCRIARPNPIKPTVKGALAYFAENYRGQGPPSESQTRRLLSLPENTDAKTEDLLEFSFFRWPESMVPSGLPWDASQSALELLRYHYKMSLPRPEVRVVKWFYWITRAAPDLKIEGRWYFALCYSIAETEPRPSVVAKKIEDVEKYLIKGGPFPQLLLGYPHSHTFDVLTGGATPAASWWPPEQEETDANKRPVVFLGETIDLSELFNGKKEEAHGETQS